LLFSKYSVSKNSNLSKKNANKFSDYCLYKHIAKSDEYNSEIKFKTSQDRQPVSGYPPGYIDTGNFHFYSKIDELRMGKKVNTHLKYKYMIKNSH